jgi:methionyl-tRNA formyltransferase
VTAAEHAEHAEKMRSRIGFLVSGPKGFSLLQGIHRECDVQFVSSHPVKGLQVDAYRDVKAFCEAEGYPFLDREQLSAEALQRASHVFVAGWQYLIAHELERLVVFHDSLLPELRGFAPTVTALICGKPRIGVTAFRPVEEFDAGPIYAQSAVPVTYPLKIREAYATLAACYADAARQVLTSIAAGRLQESARIQNGQEATYSVWRGPEDYVIDWRWPASRIKRFVDAVGWPYEGAQTTCGKERIVVDEVMERDELHFEDRHPGKIWRLERGAPEVICGSGMIRIVAARTAAGKDVVFTRVRERLGAWAG